MSDLRKAAEMALEAWDWDWSEPRNEALRERMEALRQALAQPKQEPVAWMHKEGDRIKDFYTADEGEDCENCEHCVPLYTAPPKREWVGLTDEDFYGQSELQVMAMKYAEAKLKEKNT